jgi:hypothetical protein
MKTATKNNQQNYHVLITADTTAKEVFKKISNVFQWWTTNSEGHSEKLNDAFTVRFGETFVKFTVTDVVDYKRIAWEVTDCYLHWLNDKTEWKNTKIVFEISEQKGSIKINMSHIGLMPGLECYETCEKGWDFYIKQSLYKLVTTGKGLPETPKALR